MDELLTCIQTNPGILLWLAGLTFTVFSVGAGVGYKWQSREIRLLRWERGRLMDQIAEESQAGKGAKMRDVEEHWMQTAEVMISRAREQAQKDLDASNARLARREQDLAQASEEKAALAAAHDAERRENERLRTLVETLGELRTRTATLGEYVLSRVRERARERSERAAREAADRIVQFIIPGDQTDWLQEIEREAVALYGAQMAGTIVNAQHFPEYRGGSTILRVRGDAWERYAREHKQTDDWIFLQPAERHDQVSDAIRRWTHDYLRYYQRHPHESLSAMSTTGESGGYVIVEHQHGAGVGKDRTRLVVIATVNHVGVIPAAKLFRGPWEVVDRESMQWIREHSLGRFPHAAE